MLIRLAFLVVFVGAVGVFTGTIKPAEIWSKVPHPGQAVHKKLYVEMVSGDFQRLETLGGSMDFSECTGPANAGACYATLQQVLGALRAFDNDLKRVTPPKEFAATHASLQKAVAKGIQGVTEAQRAVSTHRRRDWRQARRLLQASDALFLRALAQLPSESSSG
jgi:hypothetical protein